jgi:4'-phosphopantetheinyl transferase
MNSSQSVWRRPPRHPELGHDVVHVWRAALNRPPSIVEAFRSILAPDETDRANRFHFAKDRDHFIVSRATLRLILSRYLQIEPRSLRFCYGQHGKPALANEKMLRFNLSHSHELALYAVTRNREIGIDLEYIREDFAVEEIAKDYFSQLEVVMLRDLPANLRVEGFFNCWTRKEAYVKARSEGLSLPLNEFDVSLIPGDPVRLLNVLNNQEEATRWSLRGLEPGAGYVAAVAIEGQDVHLDCWQWTEEEAEL